MPVEDKYPTIKQLTANKTRVGVWLPPAIRAKLYDMSEEDGVSISHRLCALITRYVYPDLPVRQRGYVPGYMITKSRMVEMGIAEAMMNQRDMSDELDDTSSKYDPPEMTDIDTFERWLVNSGMVETPLQAKIVTAMSRKNIGMLGVTSETDVVAGGKGFVAQIA